MRRTAAAVVIQTRIRAFMALKEYRRSLFLIRWLQKRVRANINKRRLMAQLEEQRSAAHLKDVTFKLEGKLLELTRQLDESQTQVMELTEKLRLAQDEVRQINKAQENTIMRATRELTQRVGALERAKQQADQRCVELTEQVASTQAELEQAQLSASNERQEHEAARDELNRKLAELEAELESSRAQLADARAQHQQQMLVLQQQSSSAHNTGELTSSIKRNDAASANRWRAAAGFSATGYDVNDSIGSPPLSRASQAPVPATAPASATSVAARHLAGGMAQPVSASQSLQQRRPHSIDQPSGSDGLRGIESPTSSKRSTIGGDEGRTLAKMLSSLGGFGSAGNGGVQGNGHSSLGSTAIPEEHEEELIVLHNEDEVRDMLEHEDALVAEVLNELIGDLQVPLPNLDAEYSPPDLLFPAHLIGLCVIKMFQYNLARRIDRLLMSTIARVQKKTAAFESDYTSAFWLSNVFELLSIIKTSMTEHQSSTYEYADSERAMNDGMQYLESLLSDIYFGWIKDLQKRFVKLIIPGVVESEALPGFTASDSGFFNRLMGAGPRESTVKIENVLSFFNHIWRTMEFYYVDQAIMRQIMSELLCNIGVTAFNNIIMRRNFCSWKRGMQIQYNLTRIEEWCKTHAVSDSTRNLDRLLQLVKLLQLQKSTEQDIDIMFEVCDLLNPAQIKKLLSIYAVSDYENPIIGPVMNEVTKRAAPSEKIDKILLDTNDLNDQVLYLTARKVPAIETYIPPEFRMPRIRALVDSQTDMAYDEDDEDIVDEYAEYGQEPAPPYSMDHQAF
ncbi:Myosin type-2 heavy chain 1 [Coemansia sp. RSA 2599]|nr:Myosin type-2 heavy chain 1 [Coemansia sp. RSA 2598]KAJ1825783.1 Myosin type-2 heavy chain 1 [Coemansia sp. RSA 2599]